MAYSKMAFVYDTLMEDAPYDQWEKFTLSIFEKFGTNIHTIADLGCGTGQVTNRLAQHGFHLYGIDLSEDMLSYAQQSQATNSEKITWIKQDIRHLEGFNDLDAIISYCDVINYITELADLELVFNNVKRSLREGGLFIFDVHSIYHLEHHLKGQTFAEVYDDLSYVWFCESGENPGEVIHDLTFFVLDEYQYERFDETHHQRTFPVNTYRDLLEKTGFTVKGIYADFDFENEARLSNDQRLFFVCESKETR